MRLLLDSHSLLWSIYRPERLSARAANLIRDPANDLCRSDASLWEISLKLAKGKLEYESNLAVLYAQIDLLHLQAIPITPVHIERAVLLPPWHQDPFDRMIVAQAQAEDLPLISCDTNIRRYDVNVLW